MPDVNRHIDEAALLSYSVGACSATDDSVISAHLEDCLPCRKTLEAVGQLDSTLRSLADAGELTGHLRTTSLPVGDPFRLRPPIRDRTQRVAGMEVIRASDVGIGLSGDLLEDLKRARRPGALLKRLDLDRPETRFGLFYALQESAKRITEGPAVALAIAEAVLGLHRQAGRRSRGTSADAVLPWSSVEGQAHLLAAQANLWRGSFDSARAHLARAFRAFAKGSDESALAVVELTEAQRRAFTGEGPQALALATRARLTFEERGMSDLAARARVAEGLALSSLNEFEAAISAYREALPIFEEMGLWSNYVGAVNSLATALYRSGRLGEARREFARVFRRLSRKEHRSVLGYVRQGLGDILAAAGRFLEASRSFERAAELYMDCGLLGGFVKSSVSAAESFVRAGATDRASTRLRAAERAVARDRRLDRQARQELLRSIRTCGGTIDEIAELRRIISGLLPAQL